MDLLNLSNCSSYIVDATEVIRFIFLYPGDNIQDDHFANSFEPKMAHQVFGPEETIFGYYKLQIYIYSHHNTAHSLVKIKYDDVIKDSDFVKPDDIYKQLEPFLPPEYYTNSKTFMQDFVHMNSTKMFGVAKYKFINVDHAGQYNYYITTLCSVRENGFVEFHKRYETFIIWFIDAASFIDLDDPHWEIIYLYEHQESGIVTPVGFCTVYKFYAHPDQIRARISQFFILPTHQGLSIGKRFLACVYQIIWKIENLKDITVEDPTKVFNKMCNSLNAQIAMKLSVMKLPYLRKGYTIEMERQLQSLCKITKRRCKIVYEILMYACAKDDTERSEFLSHVVKPRITSEYMISLKKLRNSVGKRVANYRALPRADIERRADQLYQKYVEEDLHPAAYSIQKLHSL